MSTVIECLEDLRHNYDVLTEIVCNYPDIESAKVDLYQQLKRVYRSEYELNQRIVFVLEQDIYNDTAQVGSFLQAIQIILQDIDISNFFVCIVTTNSNINDEYQYVQSNISIDPVSFHVYFCSGHFNRICCNHGAIEGKIQSLKNVDFDQLSVQHQKLLFNDPVFCIMPWIGINVDTTSQVYPCCEFDKRHSIGTVKTQNLDEIWNSDSMKKIRKSMLSGESVSACKNCYFKEQTKQNSLRVNFNRDFSQEISKVDQTLDDGGLPDAEIKYWDIRYNNLCNFACRSCSPSASSSWYQVHNSLNPTNTLTVPLLQAADNQDQVFEQITKNIDIVTTIYFAGGEPAMINNFYKILELLIEHQRFDVQLRYNINMSRLTLKNKSLLTLWKHFKNVSVGASLDAEHDRAGYLRVGTVWTDIIKNRQAIAEHCPHVDFWVTATTGLINALHVPDFHRSWAEQGYIRADDFNVALLLAPAYQSVINAPAQLKQKIINRYQQHLDWLRPLDTTGRAVQGFISIIELCKQSGHYDSELFWHKINKLDQYHGTDLLTTFPELQNVGL
jgi:radical SAM protein with 4Fe4S-binding SPASM domain